MAPNLAGARKLQKCQSITRAKCKCQRRPINDQGLLLLRLLLQIESNSKLNTNLRLGGAVPGWRNGELLQQGGHLLLGRLVVGGFLGRVLFVERPACCCRVQDDLRVSGNLQACIPDAWMA